MGARGGSQKKIHKGEGAEQEGGRDVAQDRKKGKTKIKKIRKNEPVQETGTKQVGDEVSGESTRRANRSAKREIQDQTPTKGSRGRTRVQVLTRYRKPGAAAAKPRDTISAKKADRKFTEGQQNKSQTHQEPMKGEVGTGQPTAEEARRRDGEPPRQGEQLAEPPEQHLTPKVGAQGARGRQGDMHSTGSARPRA